MVAAILKKLIKTNKVFYFEYVASTTVNKYEFEKEDNDQFITAYQNMRFIGNIDAQNINDEKKLENICKNYAKKHENRLT